MNQHPKIPPGSFPQIHMSQTAFDAMRNLETAAMQMEAAVTAADIRASYTQLNMMRERLALYLDLLESLARTAGASSIKPQVFLRYR